MASYPIFLSADYTRKHIHLIFNHLEGAFHEENYNYLKGNGRDPSLRIGSICLRSTHS